MNTEKVLLYIILFHLYITVIEGTYFLIFKHFKTLAILIAYNFLLDLIKFTFLKTLLICIAVKIVIY